MPNNIQSISESIRNDMRNGKDGGHYLGLEQYTSEHLLNSSKADMDHIESAASQRSFKTPKDFTKFTTHRIFKQFTTNTVLATFQTPIDFGKNILNSVQVDMDQAESAVSQCSLNTTKDFTKFTTHTIFKQFTTNTILRTFQTPIDFTKNRFTGIEGTKLFCAKDFSKSFISFVSSIAEKASNVFNRAA